MTKPNEAILIVEDIPNVLDLLEMTLKFQGYNVLTSRNGEEALETLEKVKPGLIITDILMPKLDGFAMVQKIRTNPETQNIPVIFLSATYITPDDRSFALKLGASRFIEKPIDTEDFLLTVAELLSQNHITVTRPMSEPKFYVGYRERLEIKLEHKEKQIKRIERLLPNIPPAQKTSFEELYKHAVYDRDEITKELEQLEENIQKLNEKNE
jgi:DNA-binding response OmpR family regulator